MKKALITGITGQDGSYLAEFLLEKGYEVHGIVRRVASENMDQRFSRINHIKDKLVLHPGKIESFSRLLSIFDEVQPDECYHLASQSFVYESFGDAFSTMDTNINGTLNVLSALLKKAPKCKFYFAGSSEMFGNVNEVPQKESTQFNPRSPYGITKVAGFYLTKNFREAYNLFSCSGILFNHESPRRGSEFVTRKITNTIAKIKRGEENVLVLGNINAKRDWGFAGDYVKAMWLMLQQDSPDDYVISTGRTHSVKDFFDIAFSIFGLKYELVDLHEYSISEADKKVEELRKQKDKIFVVQHPRFYRPSDVHDLLGDFSKAKEKFGWEPKVSFEELVNMMLQRDLNSS